MDDFYYFMDGTKAKGKAASQRTEDSVIWEHQPIVKQPLTTENNHS